MARLGPDLVDGQGRIACRASPALRRDRPVSDARPRHRWRRGHRPRAAGAARGAGATRPVGRPPAAAGRGPARCRAPRGRPRGRRPRADRRLPTARSCSTSRRPSSDPSSPRSSGTRTGPTTSWSRTVSSRAAARIAQVRAFVFASSYLVYDTDRYLFASPPPDAVPLAEDAPICAPQPVRRGQALRRGGARFRPGCPAGPVPDDRCADLSASTAVARGTWSRAGFAPRSTANRSRSITRRTASTTSSAATSRTACCASRWNPRPRAPINLAPGHARRSATSFASIEEATGGAWRRGRQARVDEPYEASRADTGRLRAGPRLDAADHARGRRRPARRPRARGDRAIGCTRPAREAVAASPRIVVDPEWGYRRLDPLPAAAGLERFYESRYRDMLDGGGRAPDLARSSWRRGRRRGAGRWPRPRSTRTCSRPSRTRASDGRPRRVLDVGCGHRRALALPRRRAAGRRSGSSRRPQIAEVGRAEGLAIEATTAGTFVEHRGPSAASRFGAITLLNVLEHVPDPVGLLVAISTRPRTRRPRHRPRPE